MWRSPIRVIAIGLCMGAAEVVPGVSGGTIAFITGIYRRLLGGIQHFTPALIGELMRDGFIKTWLRTDSTFLLILFGSMFAGILTFARGVSFLLSEYPILIWSFFFGLVLASAFVVANQVEKKDLHSALAATAGVAIGLVITMVIPIELEPSPLTLFIGGFIAVCAWILPGLSGSFLLLILGLYAFVIESVRSLDIYHLSFLAMGCIVGIVTFSRLLSMLLARYQDQTLALLTGFMLGSLVKLWPWKTTTSYLLQSDGRQIPLVQEPIMPVDYAALTGADPQIALAIAIAVAGCLLVLLVDWLVIEEDDG